MAGALAGKVAVVCGATRGAGRAIAVALGEAGATVYCVGRSSRSSQRKRPAGASPMALEGRPETIEETAEKVTAAGGAGVAHQADLSSEEAAVALFARVKDAHGSLDVLVNDIWGGDELTEWGTPFWKLELAKGFRMCEQALRTHIIASRHGVPLLLEGGSGLVVEVTDGVGARYRGNLFYDLVKSSVCRLALGMAEELRPHGAAAVALSPGYLRSEAMLEHFGVTEENWREAVAKDENFAHSETPLFLGRAIAALAADEKVLEKSGGVYASWELAKEYGFTDADGSTPDWGAHFATLKL